jgi:NAD(P)-dependent dehydrogenase (short-subunit alcohol dehydrogenase family)
MNHPGFSAIMTRASKGLGAVFAEALAARGMNVVLVARSLPALTVLVGQKTPGVFDRKCAVAYPARTRVRVTTRLPRFPSRSLTVRSATMASGKTGVHN